MFLTKMTVSLRSFLPKESTLMPSSSKNFFVSMIIWVSATASRTPMLSASGFKISALETLRRSAIDAAIASDYVGSVMESSHQYPRTIKFKRAPTGCYGNRTYVHVKTVPVKVHSTLTLLLQLALLLDRQRATTRSERVVLILLWLWLLLGSENMQQTTHKKLLVQC